MPKVQGQSPDRLTQECQSVAKHHGWPQVVNEIQIREAPSLAVVPEEPARPGPAIRAGPGPRLQPPNLPDSPEEANAGWTHLSDTRVAKAASLARMLQDRAEPRRLLRIAFMAKILQMLRTLGKRRGKPFTLQITPVPPPHWKWPSCRSAFHRLPHRLQLQLGQQNRKLNSGIYKLSPGSVNSVTHPDGMGFVSRFDFRGGSKIFIALHGSAPPLSVEVPRILLFFGSWTLYASASGKNNLGFYHSAVRGEEKGQTSSLFLPCALPEPPPVLLP